MKIGTTTDSDIEITMVDDKGNPVNPADYLPVFSGKPYSATDQEFDDLIVTVYQECNTSPEGALAVAEVIIRRIQNNYLGYTNISDMVRNPARTYSGWHDGIKNRT